MIPALPPPVAAVVASWPIAAQDRLQAVRAILWRTAADDPAIGPLTETLKWGEASWLPASRAGTTLRLGWKAARPAEIALLVHCRTTLVETMRVLHPGAFDYDGTRALWMPLTGPLPEAPLRHAVRLGLTYHLRSA